MTRTCSVARSGHNRDDCWDVEARVGEIVRVEFTSINMEPIHDHLYVSGESVAGGGPMVGAKGGPSHCLLGWCVGVVGCDG